MPIFFPEMKLVTPRQLPETRKDISMQKLIDKHKIFFLDAYGVLRARTGHYPFAERTLKEIVNQGKILGIASNTSQALPEESQANLRKLGVEVPLELIFTSGMVLSRYVREKGLMGSHAICVGNDVSQQYAIRAGLKPLAPQDAMLNYKDADVVIVCENVTSKDEAKLLDAAASALFVNNAHFVLTTTDRFVPYFHDQTPSGFSVGVAATAIALSTLTGVEPEIISKPAQGMFDMLKEVLVAKNIGLAEVLFGGDNLYEDIAGATIAGFPTLLLGSGMSGAVSNGTIKRGTVFETDQQLMTAGFRPTYYLDSVELMEAN